VIGITDGARIAALFAPYGVGDPVAAGWSIEGIRIPARSIELSLVATDGSRALLRLLPADPDGGGEQTRNFRVQRSLPLLQGGGRTAADLLVEALRANDVESPWIDPKWGTLSSAGKEMREMEAKARSASEKARVAADLEALEWRDRLDWDREADPDALTEHDLFHGRPPNLAEEIDATWVERIERSIRARRLLFEARAADLGLLGRAALAVQVSIDEGLVPWLILVAAFAAVVAWALRRRPPQRWVAARAAAVLGLWLFPYLDEPHRLPRNVMLVLGDGIVTTLLLIGVVAALTARRLRGSPPRVWWALAGLLAAGAFLRVTLSQPTVMTAWPYVRFYDLARFVYTGPVLSFLTWSTGTTVTLVDTLHATTLVMGILGPWAVFLHAHHLTGDDGAALFAGAALAVLPAHLRFSASDVVFIPSIVVSALALVLTHVALFDSSRRWRFAAAVGLPLVLRILVVMRPLNLVFLLVVGGLVFWLRPGQAGRRRRVLVAAVAMVPALIAAAANLTSASFTTQTSEGLSPATLHRAFLQLVDPVQNTLINPGITPPLFGLAALAGTWILLRTRPRLGVFLVLWLGAFFITHGFIVPKEPAMTARYHLHLVVPFVILAGAGAAALLPRAGRWALPGALLVLGTALLHTGFVRDVEFTQMQEYRFVQEAAKEIPEGCWVMEPVERDGIPFRSRLRRVSDQLSEGVLRRRFELVLVDPEDPERLWIHRSNGQKEVEDLSRKDLRSDPPTCFYFYQGLKCSTSPAAAAGIPPGCVPPDLGAAPVTVLADALPFRIYDSNNEPPPGRDNEPDNFRPILLRLRGAPEKAP